MSLLTGDNQRAATAIGQELGIEVRAQLLPEDKRRIIGEFQGLGLTAAKVGDGINDAAALAAADVGIAMGGGTDVALETADAAILHGRVGDVAGMIELSKRIMVIIRQNTHGCPWPQGGVPRDHNFWRHRALASDFGGCRSHGARDAQRAAATRTYDPFRTQCEQIPND